VSILSLMDVTMLYPALYTTIKQLKEIQPLVLEKVWTSTSPRLAKWTSFFRDLMFLQRLFGVMYLNVVLF
jgi:hypothetical protein